MRKFDALLGGSQDLASKVISALIWLSVISTYKCCYLNSDCVYKSNDLSSKDSNYQTLGLLRWHDLGIYVDRSRLCRLQGLGFVLRLGVKTLNPKPYQVQRKSR